MLAFFFFNDTATTEIYTLSLHDALPISAREGRRRLRLAGGHHRWPRAEVLLVGPPRRPPHRDPQAGHRGGRQSGPREGRQEQGGRAVQAGRARPAVGSDRKSTRLNSSHANISYAVFCLKKKK